MTWEARMELIRKQAVLDKINELRTMLDYPYEDAIENASELEEYVESLSSNDLWVPCSQHMPEEILPYNKNATYPAINVLATLRSGVVTKLQRIGDGDYYRSSEMTWHWGRCPSGVLAWQPLPEKYVEEVKC